MMTQVEEALLNAAQRPVRVAEYQAMAELGLFEGEQVELLRGRVVRMAPQGEEHAWTVARLNGLLVKTFGDLAEVRPQLPLQVGEDSLPEPDLALVPRTERPGPRPRKAFLVIEVAWASLRLDRLVKAPLYAEGAAPEYWLLDLKQARLEVFRAPRDGLYTEHFVLGPSDVVRPVAFPERELPLAGILLPLEGS